jgi:thiamine-phosphate pyrophosphorylase
LAEGTQRDAYLKAQVEAVHRNLRFLETVAVSPIGLSTDLKSLREAIPAPASGEERDRQAFADVTAKGKDPRTAALLARRLTSKTIDLIAQLSPEGTPALPAEWAGRAKKVLDRVAERLGTDVRQETAQAIAGIYVIVDPEHTKGRPVIEVAQAALAGGASAIQLRDKLGERGKVLSTARQLQEMCRKAGAVFILNDWVDIARLAGTDGVHVGQKDIPVREARKLLTDEQVIGTSNALHQEALESESQGADYIAVGAMFPTSTKQDTRSAGIATLKQVKGAVGVPVIAIGGINESNIKQVADAGADSACVASAVTLADGPEQTTRRLVELFKH